MTAALTDEQLIAERAKFEAWKIDSEFDFEKDVGGFAWAAWQASAAGRLESLLAKQAEMERDAARYRYIRDQVAYVCIHPRYMNYPVRERTGWTMRMIMGNDDSLDAAIDAARAQSSPGAKGE